MNCFFILNNVSLGKEKTPYEIQLSDMVRKEKKDVFSRSFIRQNLPFHTFIGVRKHWKYRQQRNRGDSIHVS